MSDHPEKFEIVYEKGQGKPTFAVTGAIGGPTPGGTTIVAHLYVDSPSVPNIQILDVDEDGGVDLSSKGNAITRGHLTREIQASIVLSPAAALSLGQWLTRHANNLLGN